MSKATCCHGPYIPVGGETDNREETVDAVKFWQGYKDTNRKRNGTGFQELSSKWSVEC